MADDVRTWLLDSDPSLRWQVERDLLGAPEEVWTTTRALVATEGFGAGLLAHQDPDGQWAGGAYFPRSDGDPQWPAGEGQPCIATTWSPAQLREWGLDPAVLAGTAELLAQNCRWEYGGWNCAWVEGSTRSSVHSTLDAVRGLLAHEVATGGSDELRASRHRGEEHLLAHCLGRRSTGEPLDACLTPPVHPSRWRFDALRALEHLRAAAGHDGTAPDAPTGEPSRGVTLGASRVLAWWDAAVVPPD